MNPFETETMADLCLRQGHPDEALAIYRRLLARTVDEAARERMMRRIANVDQKSSRAGAPEEDGAAPDERDVPVHQQRSAPDARADAGERALPLPGVRARRSGDRVTIEWRLPPQIDSPRLEVLLVMNGLAGVMTETRAIELDRDVGKITLMVPDLHLARAAVGFRDGETFVPIARDGTGD